MYLSDISNEEILRNNETGDLWPFIPYIGEKIDPRNAVKSSVLNLSFFWTEMSSWILFVHGTRLHKDVSMHTAIVHWASGLFPLAETSRPGTRWESCNPHVSDLGVHLPAVGFNWKASASGARRRVCYSRDQRKETSSTRVYRRCLFSPFLDKDRTSYLDSLS